MNKVPPIGELRRICQPPHKWAPSRKLSIYVTRLLLRTPLSANQITIFSGAIYTLGAIVLMTTNPWLALVGSLLVLMGSFLDWSDGEVARYRGTASTKGATLDSVSHGVGGVSLFTFFTIGTYRANPDPLLFLLGGLLAFLWLSFSIPAFVRFARLVAKPRSGQEPPERQSIPAIGEGVLKRARDLFMPVYHPPLVPSNQNMLSLAEPVVFAAVAIHLAQSQLPWLPQFSARTGFFVYGAIWSLYYVVAITIVLIRQVNPRLVSANTSNRGGKRR